MKDPKSRDAYDECFLNSNYIGGRHGSKISTAATLVMISSAIFAGAAVAKLRSKAYHHLTAPNILAI